MIPDPDPDLEPLSAERPEPSSRSRQPPPAADLRMSVQRSFFVICTVVALAGALAIALMSGSDVSVRLGGAAMFAAGLASGWMLSRLLRRFVSRADDREQRSARQPALGAQWVPTATEARYRELFSRIPTPLVLHRAGRVVDANPAALALFGHEGVASLSGADLLQAYADGDSRERARRAFESLETQPAGAADALGDYRLETKDGRRVAVRSTSVHVETDGGPAVLSIYVDDTERQAAQEAVRRSEAMLSHLVATSPDVIILTDLATGCYAMVNRTFERVTGYTAAEVVGHGSLELGVWADPEDRSRFFALLREHGSVQDLPTRFTTKDGRPVSMLVSGARFTMDRREYLVINARDEAESARRARSALLADVSHELRTPLNGIIGLAQLARDPGVDEERRRQYLDQVLESTRSLADVISDILDLQKIEAGKLRLEVAQFDLGALLRSLQRLYGTLPEGRDLRLVFDTGPGVEGLAVGDERRVRQIVGNFLGNAVKLTAHGEVRVVSRRIDATRVRFEVRGTGPGIPAEMQPELFNPFSQADVSMTRRFGGAGLGLSICRELATLMGGTVGLESAFGHGSLFWAELPLPPVRGEATASRPLAPHDRGELHGMRVLLAEDNPVNALIAVTLLKRWGVDVSKAGDGAQALEAARRAAGEGQPFDAVLMDIQMPVMNGYEATRRLREDPATARLPIIALTAAALLSERQQALDAGVDDFLTKPIDAERLRVTLRRWITERRVG